MKRKETKDAYFHKATGKFEAKLTIDGDRVYLGVFNTEPEAKAACKAARKLYKLFEGPLEYV